MLYLILMLGFQTVLRRRATDIFITLRFVTQGLEIQREKGNTPLIVFHNHVTLNLNLFFKPGKPISMPSIPVLERQR